MDLTSRQRLLAFAVTVLALTGLGVFLFVTGTARHPAARQPPGPAATATSHPAAPATSAPNRQPAGSTAVSSQVNIYQWLPFTEQQLARAAAVAISFGDNYGTYSYQESTASYISRLQRLATLQLAEVIGSGYAAPGVASIRGQRRQVSTGRAVIDSLRAFGPSSITFVVTVSQKITQMHGTSRQSTQYAVTVSASGGGWQVNDIELASAGNQ